MYPELHSGNNNAEGIFEVACVQTTASGEIRHRDPGGSVIPLWATGSPQSQVAIHSVGLQDQGETIGNEGE